MILANENHVLKISIVSVRITIALQITQVRNIFVVTQI